MISAEGATAFSRRASDAVWVPFEASRDDAHCHCVLKTKRGRHALLPQGYPFPVPDFSTAPHSHFSVCPPCQPDPLSSHVWGGIQRISPQALYSLDLHSSTYPPEDLKIHWRMNECVYSWLSETSLSKFPLSNPRTILLYMPSFNKYLLSTYYIGGIMLASGIQWGANSINKYLLNSYCIRGTMLSSGIQ